MFKSLNSENLISFKNNVLNVKEENGKIKFKGICDGNIEGIVKDYFDFDTDYTKIKETLSKVDEFLEKSIKFALHNTKNT